MKKQLIVIGGGPAGLEAAIAAKRAGIPAEEILVIERDREPGGILNQCIHAGFGLHRFGEELTGPEYAGRFIRELREENIECLTDSMVLSLGKDRVVSFVSPKLGYVEAEAGAVVLAMGCRERTRGALNIAGTRPAGVYTAGTAQRYVNIDGYLPGRRVVILGSGDIGLIMARRMTLEGAKVLRVCEVMPYSGGLARNIAQCLNDFDIPLYLSQTVVQIHGKERVEGVTVADVDEKRIPIPGTEVFIPCDTLLLSVGLLPENEISREAGIVLDPVTGGAEVNRNRETSIPGVFACGNVLHVHDLVDYVTEEAATAGTSAARFVRGELTPDGHAVKIRRGNGVRYTVPQIYDHTVGPENEKIFFRVGRVFRNASIVISADGDAFYRRKKPILTPGEMVGVALDKDVIARLSSASDIEISIKEDA